MVFIECQVFDFCGLIAILIFFFFFFFFFFLYKYTWCSVLDCKEFYGTFCIICFLICFLSLMEFFSFSINSALGFYLFIYLFIFDFFFFFFFFLLQAQTNGKAVVPTVLFHHDSF